MSGSRASRRGRAAGKPPGKAAPGDLTQQDVDILAAGGRPAVAARRRLHTLFAAPARPAEPRPSKATAARKDAPQPVGRKELDAVQARRAAAAAVRTRIAQRSAPSDAPGRAGERKALPSRKPAKAD